MRPLALFTADPRARRRAAGTVAVLAHVALAIVRVVGRHLVVRKLRLRCVELVCDEERRKGEAGEEGALVVSMHEHESGQSLATTHIPLGVGNMTVSVS